MLPTTPIPQIEKILPNPIHTFHTLHSCVFDRKSNIITSVIKDK